METSDKRRLRIATFNNLKNRQKGTIVFLEGMCDNVDRYTKLFSGFVKRGFSYASFEWSDQKENGDRKKNVALTFDINQHIADLDEFLHSIVYSDCPPPYYFLCYDMGCLIAVSALDIINNQCSRLIGISPLFSPLGYKALSFQHKISVLMNDAGLGKLKLRRGRLLLQNFHLKNETDDEKYRRQFSTPDRRWLAHVLNATQSAQENFKKNNIRFPALFVLGNHDRRSDQSVIRHFCENVRLADIITLCGADHDILLADTRYQRQFWALFDAFIPGSHALEINH